MNLQCMWVCHGHLAGGLSGMTDVGSRYTSLTLSYLDGWRSTIVLLISYLELHFMQ